MESNPPAVEQQGRVAAAAKRACAGATKRKQSLILQEKFPFLGKEQAEASEVDLLFVGLDLSEVGVDREVDSQAVRDPILDEVQPDVPAEGV